MISESQIVLFKFPQTDQKEGKLQPALILRELPGKFNDWLVCMISSKVDQQIHELDELVTPDASDFIQSGLNLPNVILNSKHAVVEGNIILGKIRQINTERINKIKQKLSKWIINE